MKQLALKTHNAGGGPKGGRSKSNWAVLGRRALTFFFPSAAAPSVQSWWSAELLVEEEEDGFSSHSNAGRHAILSPMAIFSPTSDSAYSDPESEAEQLLTSGEGKPHESRSSKQRSPPSSSSRRLQKPSLIRREKLLERLEILAMEKSDDGDRDGLLRRSASTRSRTGACSASSLQGRQRG